MVQIDINTSVGSYAKNVLIKKGYYPAQVVAIDTYKDKDKKLVAKVLKDGTIGHQLMVKFKVFNQDANGKPTTPVIFKYQVEGGGATMEEEVSLATFVFFQYVKPDGTVSSALTPNTNAGKLFISLGYDFSSKVPIDTDKFIGKWAELNLDDYVKTEANGTSSKKSVIKAVNKYEGPVVDIKVDKASEMTEDDIDVIDA